MMILYSVAPIRNWSGWQAPLDLFTGAETATEDRHKMSRWYFAWDQAKELAKRAGWEGDVFNGPYVTVLPEVPGSHGGAPPFIGWMQKTGTLCFLATPFELPWITAWAEHRVDSRPTPIPKGTPP